MIASSSNSIKELQQGLIELGYDPGSADGILGQQTREAIIAYQKDHNLEPDGKYSGVLLFDVNVKLDIAEQEATPEGQKEKRKRETLLAMSNDELVKLIESLGKKEAEGILNILGKRAEELPVSLVFRKLGLPSEGLNALLTIPLGGLFYPAPPEGIRQFQEDIGVSPSGELTVGQFEKLKRRSARQKDTRVYTSGSAKIFASGGFAKVEGTWIIEDDKIADPINTAEITCDRVAKECVSTQASVVVPQIEKDDDSYYLNLTSQSYQILSWGTDEIVARDSGKCRVTILTLNLNSNEVFETTRNNETEACLESPISLPSLDKPRISRLIPGFETTYKFWQTRQKIVSKFINPRIRDRVKSSLKAAEPRN